MAGRSGAVLEGAWHPVLLWATILTLSQDEVSRLNREAKEKAAPVAADATADAKKAALAAPPSPRTSRAQRYTIVAKDDEEPPSRTRAPTSPYVLQPCLLDAYI